MTQLQDQERTTLDRSPAPPVQRHRPGPTRRLRLKKWRDRLIVLVMAGAAVTVGVRITRSQAASSSQLNLGVLMLTSQPIPIETSLPGLVTAVNVHAGQSVTAGERVGAIEVTTTNSKGLPVLRQRVLTAPRTGIVVDDPITLGSTLQPGVGFITLYDPAALTMVTNVPLSYLPEVAPGMTAALHAHGVPGTIDAVLQRAVPRVGTSQQSVAPDHLELVFSPTNVAQVARLIPGVQFTGSIDTKTGARGTQPVVYVK